MEDAQEGTRPGAWPDARRWLCRWLCSYSIRDYDSSGAWWTHSVRLGDAKQTAERARRGAEGHAKADCLALLLRSSTYWHPRVIAALASVERELMSATAICR